MRSNQKNNRSRGRGNNNNNNRNKNSNPLTRSYDSNGPDVRVRGNAAHVAEKYVQLARDATSSGDSVAVQNYLQHAEHYFRIISAAQAQQLAQQQAQQQAQAERAEQYEKRQENRNENRNENQGDNQNGNGQAQPVQTDQPKRADESAVSSEVGSSEAQHTDSISDEAEDASKAAPTKAPVKRARRPRRASVSDKAPASNTETIEEGGEGDPANAPQPGVSDLPSFVTSDTDSSAAE